MLACFIVALSVVSLQAQVRPLFMLDNSNNINRIDSLTLKFYSDIHTGKKPSKKYVTDAENVQEEEFLTLMQSLQSSIPFAINDNVRKQISYLKNPASQFLYKASIKQDIYFPIFEEILDKKGMPLELKYISIIESALNPNAVSWCGATGLWQFMPGTGKYMNLTINNLIDERKDIYKSTEKACEYFQMLYTQYGDWLLAIAAYNCGPGNVNKAIVRSGGHYNFWKIMNYLPKETQYYVPRFIATAFIMNFSPVVSPFVNDLAEIKPILVQVDVDSNVHLIHIAAVLGISHTQLRELNSAYKTQIVNAQSKNNIILLPYKEAMAFITYKDSIYKISNNSLNFCAYKVETNKTVYHTVKKGETMTAIAQKYHCSVGEIKSWNKLSTSKVWVGQKIKIKTTVTQTTKTVINTSNSFYYYVVEKDNENIATICNKFKGLDQDTTLRENKIPSSSTTLSFGQIIKVYTSAP